MKIERLRNKKSKLIFLCGCLMVVVLLITIVIQGSKAKYKSSQFIELITNKAVTNKVPSFTTMGIYLEDSTGTEVKNGKTYKKQENNVIIPEGYTINDTNSYCNKFDKAQNKSIIDTNAKMYTNFSDEHIMSGISEGDKCYIYLDKGFANPNSIKAQLLTKWGYVGKEITERTDLGTFRTDGGNKLHKTNDNYGTSYYLVGNPENNWVKFAGFYWRIVRINGNGTLRLIYQGSSATPTTSTDWESTTYSSCTQPYCLGFMYSEGTRIGYGTSSLVKEKLDVFYGNNLTSYDNYIDKNTGFCNDRKVERNDGYTMEVTIFAGYVRLMKNMPILACNEPSDNIFTVGTADNGNKKLTNPIGLITGDEVMFGGLVYGIKPSIRYTNMYDIGIDYWTMTPVGWDWGNSAYPFGVTKEGEVSYISVWKGDTKLLPVINLKKDITFSSGTGTSTDPFQI